MRIHNEDTIEDIRYKIRHSAAHIMAEAVINLFPGTKIGMGPPTENGFYYDFDCPKALSQEDLKVIEKEMKKIIKSKAKFSGITVSRKEAMARFAGQDYKLEIINGIPKNEKISIWSHESWEDICRGGHVESTKNIPAFKLLDVAGAYWKGDEKNPMLQRVYGTAWESKDALKEYLNKLELAAKRDHRKLGVSLDLFYFDQFAPSMPFFLPKGAFLLNKLIDYMRDKYEIHGYQEVITPQIFSSKLWDMSGHSEHFKENMFFTESENNNMGIKPMNCPSHYLLFRSQLHSYKDLPIRYADFGRLHRNERSGVSHGLTRVKSFSQDDSHIFCRFDQIEGEVSSFLNFLEEVYADFGFENPTYNLSLRPKNRSGSDEIWDKSEEIMNDILGSSGMNYSIQEGEGAFYGPKIDVTIPDALDREWQLGTVQLDFFAANKFGLNYISDDGSKEDPVVIHRAIFGSLERFLGVLIEHYGGQFPFWLSPDQFSIIPISENHFKYSLNLQSKLNELKMRGKTDVSNDRFNNKIRKAQINKTPLMIIIGDKEIESNKFTVRLRDGSNITELELENFKFLSECGSNINDDKDLSKLLKYGKV
ncbi:MAG: threonine--tRNA ligase [Chloroflexi bacterium]|nr:threonine--tRNA ligase [Chloroflexota bacterium]|tara:strand:- start:12261 stop:14036 length:1776 start_codon:yes stop_codon:yes gene_type:complete